MSDALDPVVAISSAPPPFYRHRLPTRLWHWLNALSVFVMLMSGLMILSAHPRLYWGRYGANADHAWLEIVPGHIRIAMISGRVSAYGIRFTGLESSPNNRAALAPRMLRLAVSFRNGRS